MLTGTLNVKKFCENILAETDVSLPEISLSRCYDWINSELYYIYSHIVRAFGRKEYICNNCEIDLNNETETPDIELDPGFDLLDDMDTAANSVKSNTDRIVFEDVYKMYDSSGREYVRTNLSGAIVCPIYCYYKSGDKLKFNTDFLVGPYTVIYLKRPSVITSSNADSYIIPLPDAFSSILVSRIKKEIFLLSGDIGVSNAWAQEHERQIKIFSDWYRAKEEKYVK